MQNLRYVLRYQIADTMIEVVHIPRFLLLHSFKMTFLTFRFHTSNANGEITLL